MTRIYRWIGKRTCGQLLLSSMSVNAALLTVIVATILAWPDDGADVEMKAERLQQIRQMNNVGM